MNHMYLKYLTCESQTGEHYELGKLAPGKYNKVMAETRLIQVSKTEIYLTGIYTCFKAWYDGWLWHW